MYVDRCLQGQKEVVAGWNTSSERVDGVIMCMSDGIRGCPQKEKVGKVGE